MSRPRFLADHDLNEHIVSGVRRSEPLIEFRRARDDGRHEVSDAELLEFASDQGLLIVSHDGFNQTPSWRSIIVVPISTAASQARRGPTAIALPQGAGGLPRVSVALCHQVTTLDRAKLNNRVGTLSPDLMTQVEAGLKAALHLR